MNKIYYMDDILDGEFEYQTVREVLSNNRMNILNLCNKGYLFDEEVLDRALNQNLKIYLVLII